MSKKYFSLIVIICLALFCIFLFLDKQEKEGIIVDQSKNLFADLSSENIAKINIGTKDQTIELALVSGSWGVTSRGSYPADVNHVRSLLLNVLDLNVSQKITSNKERYASLGVDDENFKDQLTFFNSENKPLGGLLLGENRKKTKDGEEASLEGQYVRRVGEIDVFLVSQRIDLQKDAFYWLDANLSNFLAAKLSSVKQYAIKDASETLLIDLQAEKDGTFKLASKTLGKKESLNLASVSKLTSALENARLQDVYKNNDQVVSALNFDLKTVYQGKDGIVYTVLTGEKDAKYYAKFSVEFDQQLVEKPEAEPASLVPEATENPSATRAAVESVSSSPTPSPTTGMASADEAKTLNARYSQWAYELPDYQAKKFRVMPEEFIQVKEVKEVESADAVSQ